MAEPAWTRGPPRGTPQVVERLILSLGGDGFASALMEAVDAGARASGCAAFRFEPGGARALVATDAEHGLAAARYARDHWRRDTTFLDKEVGRIDASTTLYHYPTEAVRDRRLVRDCYETSDTADQILLRRRVGSGVLALSVFRRRRPGRFSSDGVAGLAGLAPILLAAIARHETLARPQPRPLSRARAEGLLGALAAGLTPRETEVCALVLRGLTSEGIALELGLSKATVATLRRRAYARLGISSATELFHRCLTTPGAA